MDIIIVGAGLYGLTVARYAAEHLKLHVLLIDRRDHIGGNAYSFVDQRTNIEVHKYGSHIFHTSNVRVWEYVRRFSNFVPYEHRVFTNHSGRIYQMPINLHTVNQFFGCALDPGGAAKLLNEKRQEAAGETDSFEACARGAVGSELYDALIRGYTRKQWETDPAQLPAAVFSRLPVRLNYDSRYFTDTYQGLPECGYGTWLERMAEHSAIEVRLGLDGLASGLVSEAMASRVPIVYTGPLDEFFDRRFGQLSWRTLDFEDEIAEVDDFQGTPVMNYANEEIPYTRVHEYKHYRPDRAHALGLSWVTREYSRLALDSDEPYYPVNSSSDRALLHRYREAASLARNVHFGGRLGSYKYLDMHMAVASALTFCENSLSSFVRV